MHYWRKMNKIEAERGIWWVWELMMTMMKHKLRKKCLVTLSFDIKLIPISIIIIIIHKYFVPSPSPILHHSYIIIWSTWCSPNAHTYGKDERCTFWWDRMWREPYWIFFWEFLLFYIFSQLFSPPPPHQIYKLFYLTTTGPARISICWLSVLLWE